MNPEFVKMLAELGDSRFDGLAGTLETTAPEVSVRLNPLKAGNQTAVAASSDSKVDWWEDGVYLPSRPKFTFDPALHQGRYYVQDASSMITAAVARAISGIIAIEQGGHEGQGETTGAQEKLPLLWLDACAAPGGKTTAALDGLPHGSLVVANEYDYSRAEILKENVAKWGNPSTVITRGDTAQFRRLGELFDVIAVDAPCSGEGMMRKDLTAREQWSPALVKECCERQRGILDNLWNALRPGGFLVYSTCTFNTAENELMADRLRQEYGAVPVDLRIPAHVSDGKEKSGSASTIDKEVAIPGILPLHAMRFIPGRIRGEGLFMTVLRKPGKLTPAILLPDIDNRRQKNGKQRKTAGMKSTSMSAAVKTCRNWLAGDVAGEFEIHPTEDGIRAFPIRWDSLLPLFMKHLQVISAGTEMAIVKGKDIIPTQQLAMSVILSPAAFPTAAVGGKEAVDYLSREAVPLPPDSPRGIVLLTSGGYPLGFVKNLGNRANNLYPKEWRIKAGHQA